MLCQECSKQAVCKSACPELTMHLKETEVLLREKPIRFTLYTRWPWPSQQKEVKLTKREKEILTLFVRGISRADICSMLDITRNNLRFYLSELKSKYTKI